MKMQQKMKCRNAFYLANTKSKKSVEEEVIPKNSWNHHFSPDDTPATQSVTPGTFMQLGSFVSPFYEVCSSIALKTYSCFHRPSHVPIQLIGTDSLCFSFLNVQNILFNSTCDTCALSAESVQQL